MLHIEQLTVAQLMHIHVVISKGKVLRKIASIIASLGIKSSASMQRENEGAVAILPYYTGLHSMRF